VGGGEDERSAGLATDGEVEDFAVLVTGVDFGDAPNSYGTLNASSGAAHTILSTLYLGSAAADADANGFVDGTDDSGGTASDDEVGGDEGITQLLSSLSAFPSVVSMLGLTSIRTVRLMKTSWRVAGHRVLPLARLFKCAR